MSTPIPFIDGTVEDCARAGEGVTHAPRLRSRRRGSEWVPALLGCGFLFALLMTILPVMPDDMPGPTAFGPAPAARQSTALAAVPPSPVRGAGFRHHGT